jgi:hypothetical protein
MNTRVNRRQASALAHARKPFTSSTGSLRGVTRFEGYGRLPQEFRTPDLDHSTYIVYSYATPIGWVTPSGAWVRPEVKYSVTTSTQQGLLPVSA